MTIKQKLITLLLVAVTFLLDLFTQGSFYYLFWYGLVVVLESFRIGPHLKAGLIGITVLWFVYWLRFVYVCIFIDPFTKRGVMEAIWMIFAGGAYCFLVMGIVALLALGTVTLFRRIIRVKPKT